jgi:ArsR family transcriptional regulator
MAQNKKDKFSKIENGIADFAKALSHPARIAILKKLAEENKCICGKIVDVMPLAQSTVSQHLKELQQAGIVQGEIDGVTSCYCINWDKLDKEITNFNNLFKQIKKKNSDCC